MKVKVKYGLKCLFVLTILFVSTLAVFSQERHSDIYNFLSEIPGIKITELKTDTVFGEKYEVLIPQPVDHENPSNGTFMQRFFIYHKSAEKPMVFITEGYAANYGRMVGYQHELTHYLDANQVLAEHRYFGASVPDPLDWKYLTVENAATDHHEIIDILDDFYTDRWISTGISKGGQSAMFHRAFFPDDVDVTVGYVCPLNFSIEDRRVYDFLEKVGTEECRERIFSFQKELLRNRKKYYAAFLETARERNLSYSVGELVGYELTVLEYAFAFWQYGRYPCDSIPGPGAPADKAIQHLDNVAGLDWISDEGIRSFQPFFYQALKEIGFYGYDIAKFDDYIEGLEHGRFTFACPPGVDCTYVPETMEKVDNFIRHHAKNMMFIYGEMDPWSAPAVQLSGKTNLVKIVNPQGNHGSAIWNLPAPLREKAFLILEEWLGREIGN